jgi:hypothetical protein
MIDASAFFELWKFDETPAYEQGMGLAREFLVACGHAVEKVGISDTFTLRAEMNFRFSRYAAHRETCDRCNEL